MDLVRLHVITIRAGIANVGIGQRDDLAAIRRIRQNFLITRHRSIKDDFADCPTFGTDRPPMENRAIL